MDGSKTRERRRRRENAFGGGRKGEEEREASDKQVFKLVQLVNKKASSSLSRARWAQPGKKPGSGFRALRESKSKNTGSFNESAELANQRPRSKTLSRSGLAQRCSAR